MSTTNKKLKLILPLPPSNNKYLYPKSMGKYVRLAESATSKKWKREVTPIIKEEMTNQNWETAVRGQFLDVHIDYYFKQKGQDPNNYLKVLYDVMENCEVYENDDMCKPQTGLVVIDKFNPRIEIVITYSDQVGVFKDDIDRRLFIQKNKDLMPKRSFNALLKQLDDNRITEKVKYNDKKEINLNDE